MNKMFKLATLKTLKVTGLFGALFGGVVILICAFGFIALAMVKAYEYLEATQPLFALCLVTFVLAGTLPCLLTYIAASDALDEEAN